MTSSKYIIGILGLLLIFSLSSAYNVVGGEAYCGYGGTADAQCDDCEAAFNNVSITVTHLNQSIDGATGTCIANPSNISNSVFDGNGHYIRGTGVGYGLWVDNRDNITWYDMNISNFVRGVYIGDGCFNITLRDSVVYNNSAYGVRIYYSTYCTVNLVNIFDSGIGLSLENGVAETYHFVNYTNTSSNALYGVQLSSADDNDINNSLSYNNSIGVYVISSSNNNTFAFDHAYNNTLHGYYFDPTSGENVLYYSNATNNTRNGFYFNSADDNVMSYCIADLNGWYGFEIINGAGGNQIYESEAKFNGLNGIDLEEGADDTSIVNTVTHDNGDHGIAANGPLNNLTIASIFGTMSSYGNGKDGIFIDDRVTDSVIWGSIVVGLVNVHSNGNYGIAMYNDSENINVSGFISRNNTWSGIHVDTSNNTRFVSGTVYNNGYHGFGVYGYNNTFISNTVYNNGWSGFGIGTGAGTVLLNTFTGNEVYNNTFNGFHVDDDWNVFANNIVYGNSYDVRLTANANDNDIYNMTVYTNKTGFENTNFIIQSTTAGNSNNFTNTTVCYNETIGCTNWAFFNLTDAFLQSSNFIAHPYFISLDASAPNGGAQFNSTANITIAVDRCEPAPRVIKRTGFPTTLADILAGDPYSTTSVCSNNVISFPVTEFSGYAANASLTECFYANNPDTVYNVEANLVGNKSDGICITINASNIMINCSGYSITGNTSVGSTYGISTRLSPPPYPDLENITIQGCIVSNYTENGIRVWSSVDNATVIDNTVFGIYDTGGGTGYAGIYVNSNFSIISNNTVANNSQNGLVVRSILWTNVTDNIAYNNSGYGILSRADGGNPYYNRYINNRAYNNTNGIGITGTYFSTTLDNLAYGNDQNGFVVLNSYNNTLENNSAYGNNYGFTLFNARDNNFTNNTIRNNVLYGFFYYLSSTSNIVKNSTFYGNGYDMFINNSGVTSTTITVINSTFTNPMGTLENYTVLTFTDTLDPLSSYTINWTALTVALPTNYISFAQKFINITAQVGTVVIDSVTWHWSDAELGGYNESLFVLSKYNASGWTHLNNTPDTAGNTLSLTNVTPTSTFGILQNNTLPNYCMVISSPGVYALPGHTFGAPYTFANIWGLSRTCILIQSNDVDFSCNGYNITNNGTANSVAIAVNGSFVPHYTNITIRDCPAISAYRGGIYTQNTDDSRIQNITSYSNTEAGFLVINGQNNNLTNNIAHGPGMPAGFSLTGLGGNFLINNTVYRTTNGFYISSCNNNNLTNNWAYNNSIGYYIGGSSNQIWYNWAETNNQYGFQLRNANNNWVVNNSAWGNHNHGFFVDGSNLGANGNRLINNSAYSNWDHGFYLFINGGGGVANTRLTNNTAHSNWDHGFYLYEVTNSNLTANTAYSNTQHGVFVRRSDVYASGGQIYGNNDGIRVAANGGTASTLEIQDVHLYNNNLDLYITSDGTAAYTLNATNVTIDNNAGSFQNYTSISVNDTGSAAETYTIDWVAEPATPPTAYFSFRQKYLTIAPAVGAPTLDLMRFNWYTSELTPPYNETLFEIWRHNGSAWNNVSGQVKSISGNYIEIPNFNPASNFGILQNNDTPPRLTIQSPVNNTDYNTTNDVDLNYTVFDDLGVDSCWYFLNGAGPTALPGCANITLASLLNGQYNLTVFVNDTANKQNSSDINFTVSLPPPPPTGGRGGGAPRCVDASIAIDYILCPEGKVTFVITDKDRGTPAVDARVVVRGTWPWSDVKYTDSSGIVEFILPYGPYDIFVDGGRMEDYCSDTLTVDSFCPEGGCYDDDDCLDTEYCDLGGVVYSPEMPIEVLEGLVVTGICRPVECECGEVYSHRCHPYECCRNADCPEGEVCEDHTCVPRCQSDSECGASESCSDGECVPIPVGECGYIMSHEWIDYECCVDEDCPEDYICYDHICVWIETNETGFVGDEHEVRVHPEGQYDLEMTDPDGREFMVITDENGFGTFRLETEGHYGVALLEDNESRANVTVQSLKRPLPPPEEKPVTILDEILKYFWWLLILLILIIGYILFRRRKTKRYKVKKE